MTAATHDHAHRGVARGRPTVGLTVYGCDPDEANLFARLAPALGVHPILTAASPSPATAYLTGHRRLVSVSHKTPVSNATLLAWSRSGVEYLSTRSAGHDHIDVDYAVKVGITVGTVSYSPDSVADYTLMQILMVLRHAVSTVRAVDTGDYRLGPHRGRELRDLTVGVVGTGRIGTAVIRRLSGFGCTVLSHDLRGGRGAVGLEHLLSRSDVVTLHIPLLEDTHRLLDARQIARMKPGAVVINTGRGGLIDTAALVDALEDRRLGGAALDVIEDEGGIFYTDRRRTPFQHDALDRLRALPNVLITPHTAYYTDHALSDTVTDTLRGCVAYERNNHRA